MAGRFITLYGINNIGKSTHAKLLVERLEREGYKARFVKYPVYDLGPTGPFLDGVLRGGHQKIAEDELQLWFVMNRYQFEPELRRWLEEGYVVVAEDYIGTGVAWGTAKGLEMEWLENMNKHLLKEDFAILFEGTRDVSAREDGHVHEQNDELMEKCRGVFSELADRHGWKKLKVREKVEDTAEALWEMVRTFLV